MRADPWPEWYLLIYTSTKEEVLYHRLIDRDLNKIPQSRNCLLFLHQVGDAGARTVFSLIQFVFPLKTQFTPDQFARSTSQFLRSMPQKMHRSSSIGVQIARIHQATSDSIELIHRYPMPHRKSYIEHTANHPGVLPPTSN